MAPIPWTVQCQLRQPRADQPQLTKGRRCALKHEALRPSSRDCFLRAANVSKYFFPTWDSLWYFRECQNILMDHTMFRLWTAGWPGPTPIDKAYWRFRLVRQAQTGSV